jgi:hypothetical protein
VLETEVTPGLLAGAELDAHQFLCHDFMNGGGKMERDPGTRVRYVESKGGLDPTSVSRLLKGW